LLNCLSSLAQLTHLTLLELDGFMSSNESRLLPLQQLLALPLPLRVLRIPDYYNTGLDLSKLHQLKEVSIGRGLLYNNFPPQLQQLNAGFVEDDKDIQVVMQLQQLQRLSFDVAFDAPELLVRLTELPALQHLALQYAGHVAAAEQAAATAAAWPRLRQLRELTLE
jgi:hypothetical protein